MLFKIKNLSKTFFLVVILSTTCFFSFSQDTLKVKIDQMVNPLINSNKNIGMIIGIVSGENTFIYHYGSTRNDTIIPPDENTLFEIGSITKVFTAIILADMVNDSIVHLSDAVQKFLPDSVKIEKYEASTMTLEHLANHTSSLPRLPVNLNKTITDADNPYANYTKSELYYFLKNEFTPRRKSGMKYEYSNLGMGLLGNIIAEKENLSYEELLKKRICNKLQMNNTVIDLNESQKKNLAQGHNQKGKPVPVWDIPAFEGAGAIKSNLNDMLVFLKANIGLLKNNPLQKAMDSCQLVTISTVDLQLEIGLGWHISPLGKNSEAIIWHNGGTGGYRSYIGFVKPEKKGVVILTNSANGVDKTGTDILDLIIPYNPDLEKKDEPDIIQYLKKRNKENEKK